ncbi:MAG: ABC transporter substrate-binding protein [Actinomycetota bacterium]|nr:ABC transporter substrate-binding protein [Actinomycetota bacterium]
MPQSITVGTLYASVGPYAPSSLAQYRGLRFWAKRVNEHGGTYVKAYGRKVKVRLIAYNDQSSTSQASALAAKLIEQDHVNILVSDFGSVLTSVVVPLAQENGVLLFDPTATAPGFFTESIFGNGDPDLVLTSLPSSALWPRVISTYLLRRHLDKVGIVYDANDFSQAQATTVENALGQADVIPSVVTAVPTSTSSYAQVITSMRQAGVQAVLEFGYGSNDLAFLGDLAAANVHFPFVFTAFPGLTLPTFLDSLGAKSLNGIYTYLGPPLIAFKANYGMSTAQFLRAYAPGRESTVSDLDVAGYVAGLVVQATLAHATGLTTADLRAAAHALSGKVTTLAGPFALDTAGSQVGEMMPLARLVATPGGGVREAVVQRAPQQS